ncbi:hypothetical protein PMZ80_002162 [Knufia obscura]|uniref:Uncharacterized protein n=1 Tax=Knufia obscura TaxID=1635080 RepID=A0ABR0RXH5_9EURO|nr:hypothetical protein PMZ80_002162 [Knufia obscura]
MADRGGGRGRGRGRGRGGGRGNDRRQGYGDARYINGDTNGEMNAHLTERFKGSARRNGSDRESANNSSKILVNPDVAKYVQAQEAICEKAEPGDWLAMPEIPPSSEVCLPEGASIVLPRNRIDQPWSKPERYLKAHYKLLREDAIAPLREAVDRFRKDPQRMDDNETRIYEQVRVVGLTFTFKGIASRIRFSTARSGRNIQWSSSKRLTSGTLVALTPKDNNFETKCILAVVAARPMQNLESDVAPEVDILFGDPNDLEIDSQNSYIMIEATQGYYEAYRHTLRALQKQSQELFPLAEHICKLDPNVEAPDYVKQMSERDITPAADDLTRDAFRNVDILKSWPSAPSSTLDQTQWAAMRDILTRKLAIIQGPPGTGKTHVSKIAIDILLKNKTHGDAPIIVACQTNHALDQLLSFINEFEPNFIRLGGRSVHAVVKPRALHEVRRNENIEDLQRSCFQKARRDNNIEIMKLKTLLTPVRGDESSTSPKPMTADILCDLNVITEQQRKSLAAGAEQWVRTDTSTDEPLQVWLGQAVSPFVPRYAQDSFGFEEAEEDLELEQLKELEAEMGVADEEDFELLKGEWLPLAMGYTCSPPTSQAFDQAKRMLDTVTDLCRVPEYLKGAMYLIMQEKAKKTVKYRLRELAQAYEKTTTQIQIGRWERDLAYLSKASIIGMTTTGLSKYRALVSALKPKIVLIEEAAEVLEAPVGVACVESIEHLILVGDHQQLQAHCSVRELEGEPYHLNISMFERLVRNKIPHKTLLRQRRTEPEFRELIAPIYPELQDHPSVVTRSRTQWGLGQNYSWFYNHDNHELQDESMSTFNEYEARMVAKFYRHLMRNRVPAAAITVLSFYNGQRKKILRYLKDDPGTASVYNRVKTVDSYQGEENYIVLLSLVRSNISGKIGFLDINNRIVVALSRAQYGFYIFGNGPFLAEHNEVWDYVEMLMYKKGKSGNYIPLICANHGNETRVKHVEDFDALNGGCAQLCGGVLTCGHPCPLRCHPSPHEWVNCHRKCTKELECGHFCMKQCSDDCGCECEAYRRFEEEARGGPIPDTTPQWNELAKGSLTEENLSRVSYAANGNSASTRLVADEDDFVETKSVQQRVSNLPKETTREKQGGRVRYEQHWQNEPPSKPPTQALNQLRANGKQEESRHSIKEGKKREVAERQPRGPPAWGSTGFDGANDQVNDWQEAKENKIAEPVEEVNLMTWDQEPVERSNNAFEEWLDPEQLQFQREQEQQVKEMGAAFW